MSVVNDLEAVVSYKCLEREQPAIEEIINYMENKFEVNVYKIQLIRKESENINRILIYLKTNKDNAQVREKAEMGDFLFCYPTEAKNICEILQKNNLTFSQNLAEGFGLMFCSFEELALRACYCSAFEEYKSFKEQIFNTNTMEKIEAQVLYITYKTKQDLENAQKTGEIELFTNKYFNIIKKYDTYNYVTKEQNLITRFDSVENKIDSRSFADYVSSYMQGNQNVVKL
ncbi:MAG: hypothetical protein IJW32_03630 [Clostridia bacterium]|nr:hypothetical protein [Clostridia bacterium]